MKSPDSVNVWNRASDLAIKTLKALKFCDEPGLCDQAARAALQVATKIAVGCEREPCQFRQHLLAANGSCAALRTHLHAAAELGIIDGDQSTRLIKESLEISGMLRTLIRSGTTSH
jgi:four helix bundle protein